MLQILLSAIILQCISAMPHIMRENWFKTTPSAGAFGDIIQEIVGETPEYCSVMCAGNVACTGINYFVNTKTCVLLHVEDVLDDWENMDDVTHSCMNCEPGPKVSIGLWPFIDEASNLRNPSATVVTFDTPFLPAFPGASANVVTFLGHQDSYIELQHTEELAVSSFTWTAAIFPEGASAGPLFNWWCDCPGDCWYRGPHILMNDNQQLVYGVCHGTTVSWTSNPTVISINNWHQVAVAYDAVTGDVQTSVDGILHSYNIGLPAAGTTVGPVLMGSRYHHSGTNFPDARVFQGKIACMRLWNTVRDLTSLRMDTPLCVTN